MSRMNTSKTPALRARQKRNNGPLASQKANGRLGARSRAQVERPTISQELIADRLGCMLKQIRGGRTSQVLLHTAVIASTLNLGYPNAQTVRDMVHEAQALFMRGHRHLAEKRIQAAIDTWDTSQKQTGRVGLSRLRSQAARA